MCELFCLSSRMPTRATISLRTFADRGGPSGHSIDGWGLAVYDDRDIRLYKEPEPAGNSAWLDFIQDRRLPARLLISHIRHATRGKLTLANTQPFTRELGGRMHVFAHNGRLDGIDDRIVRPGRRYRELGDTDSEIAFCLLLEAMTSIWHDACPPSMEARLAIVVDFAAAMRSLGPANFLYSDGEFVFAHGHRRMQSDGTITSPGLWRLRRDCAADPDALTPAGITLAPSETSQQLILFASVPLSEEPWRPLSEGEIAVAADGQQVWTAMPSPPRAGLINPEVGTSTRATNSNSTSSSGVIKVTR